MGSDGVSMALPSTEDDDSITALSGQSITNGWDEFWSSEPGDMAGATTLSAAQSAEAIDVQQE